jgi:hypothetical protein
MPTLPVKAATSRTTPNPTKAHQQETSDRPEAIWRTNSFIKQMLSADAFYWTAVPVW